MAFCYWATVVAVCLFLVGLGGYCLRRALLDGVRQNFFRARARIIDRVIAGELGLKEPSVSSLIDFIQTMVYVLESASIVDVVAAVIYTRKPVTMPACFDDDRLKPEVDALMLETCKGLLCVSSFLVVLLIVALFASEGSKFLAWERKVASGLAERVGLRWGQTASARAKTGSARLSG